jgi:hypothetical protein
MQPASEELITVPPWFPVVTVSRGLPDGVTRSRLRTNAFEQVSRDLYVRRGALHSYANRCVALAVVLPPSAAFCLGTAAQLAGLPLPLGWDPERIDVVVPGSVTLPRRRAVTTHQWVLPPSHVGLVDGLRVVTPDRSLLEFAARASLEDVVAFGDAALRHALTNIEALQTTVGAAHRRRGVVPARRAVQWLDPRAESPQESRTRVRLRLAGLPRATPNVWISDANGVPVARVDLLFEGYRVVVEYEGEHHRSASQYASDLRRRNLLQQLGYLVVHVEKSLLTSRVALVQAVSTALRRRGWRGEPDLTFRSDWAPDQ